MSNSENSGNPVIGMQGSNLEQMSKNTTAQVTPKAPKTGSNEFFDSLDQEVNGQIRDNEVTPNQQSGPTQVTHANIEKGSKKVVEQSQHGTDWQKRYKDSSREAVRWRDKFKSVEPFVPVLEAMKNDSGLVDHVRGYFENGGKPAASIKNKLNLPEDFVYDQQEAITDPESDSAKVMNAHVDGLVENRVQKIVAQEKERNSKLERAQLMKQQEDQFKKQHNMSEKEFADFKLQAREHKMTLNDVHYVLNKDKAAANVAQSTKKEMINQMRNVQSMPTTASGANSQGKGHKSEDRQVFENILGFESGKDNLFG